MPTTPDDPAPSRRRLGQGAAAAAEPQQNLPAAETGTAALPGPAAADGAPGADGVAAGSTPGPDTAAETGASATPAPGRAVDGSTPQEETPPDGAGGEVEDALAAEGSGQETGSGGTTGGDARFRVRLANFEGPFDLLLQLISKHKLDVTEVALSKVTNEFIAHIHAMGPDWDLDQATEFLVVAATLLDLKAARLLPAAEVEDEGDLALLEARDLLFARLLQYRAYKKIAAIFAERLAAEALSRPRTVGLEPQHAELLPEVVLSIGPERFAQLAVKAMQPRPKPQVYVDHIHAPLVSVREQAEHVIALLRARGAASFGELTADAGDTLTVVARFLALLELYREKAVALEQPEALGALTIRWTGGEEEAGRPLVTDEFDQEAAAAAAVRDKAARIGAAAAPVSEPAPASAAPTTTEPGPSGEGEPR